MTDLSVKVSPEAYARAWNTASRTATYLAWFAVRGDNLHQKMLFSELLSDHLAACEELGFGRPDVSDVEATARRMNATDLEARWAQAQAAINAGADPVMVDEALKKEATA